MTDYKFYGIKIKDQPGTSFKLHSLIKNKKVTMLYTTKDIIGFGVGVGDNTTFLLI